jgi:multidrug efflux pump subunit AcrA (membrane-fusion protein)
MLTFIFALALTACANQAAPTQSPAAQNQPAPDGIVAEGNLKPIHAVNLSFQARGTVEEIKVKIGDSVKKGDLLARLSNFDVAMAPLTAANLELNQTQQAYDQLVRTEGLDRAAAWTTYMNAQIVRAAAQAAWDDVNPGEVQTRVDDQQATVNDRKKDLADAQDEFDKYKSLDQDNSKRKTAEDKLRAAQKDYDSAVSELEDIQRGSDSVRAGLDSALAAESESKYQFEQTVDGVNKEKLAVLSARLDNAKAQVAAAEDALSNYQITAPFDGVVAEVNVEVGEQVGVETRAVSLIDASSWIIETTDVTELDVVNLVPGQAVTFTADALPGVAMHGVVTEISASSLLQGGDVNYTVRIAAGEVDPRVRWGMTVEVVFEPIQ